MCLLHVTSSTFARAQAEADTPRQASQPSRPAAPTKTVSYEGLLRRAKQDPPAVWSALATLQRAESEVDYAQGQWFPSLALDGSYGFALDNRLVLPNAPRIDSRSLEARGNVRVEWRAIDVARGYRIAAASSAERAARHGLHSAEQQAMLAAAELYHYALAARSLLADAELTLTRRTRQLEAASALVEAGTRSSVDVQRAEVEVTAARYGVELRRSEHEAYLAALGVALGEAPGTLVQPLDAPPLAEAPASNPTVVATLAVEHHPDVSSAELQVQLAEEQRLAAVAERWPVVGLSASATVSHLDVRRGAGIAGYQYGGVVSAFLAFYGLDPELWLKADTAAAAVVEARRAREELSQRVGAEAVAALFALRRASIARKQSIAVLESAQRAREATQGRYGAGLASLLELLDTEDLEQQARLRRIEAQRDEALAAVRLQARCGKLGEAP